MENSKRSSLRHGFLAFYPYTKTPKIIDKSADERVERWISSINDTVKKYGVIASGYKIFIRNEDGEYAYAVAIAISSPSRREKAIA